MPPLTRWHIKTAFISLAAAMTLGVALALALVLPLPGWVVYLSPAFFHLIMVGWVTQMIFGVIFWMFPIVSRARPRGNERLGWATYVLLNGGLLLRVVGDLLPSMSMRRWGGLLNAVVVVIFLLNTVASVRRPAACGPASTPSAPTCA